MALTAMAASLGNFREKAIRFPPLAGCELAIYFVHGAKPSGTMGSYVQSRDDWWTIEGSERSCFVGCAEQLLDTVAIHGWRAFLVGPVLLNRCFGTIHL
jgi:hypothetical protein